MWSVSLILSQLTVSKRIKNLLRFCLHILLHFCWYNSLATCVHTALRTVLSFLFVYFSLFGLCSSCLSLWKEEMMYRKTINLLCGHTYPKSKRQSKTNIHTKMKCVLWRVRYIRFLLYRWKSISCLDLEIYSCWFL